MAAMATTFQIKIQFAEGKYYLFIYGPILDAAITSAENWRTLSWHKAMYIDVHCHN
jgi:hypothetical protein